MPLGLLAFGGCKSLSFNSNSMQQLGARNIFQVFKMPAQCIHIMAIHRAVIFKSQGLKERTGCNSGRYCFLKLGCCFAHLIPSRFKMAEQIINFVANFIKCLTGGDIRQIFLKRPYIGVNRHVVVVQDHQHILV